MSHGMRRSSALLLLLLVFMQVGAIAQNTQPTPPGSDLPAWLRIGAVRFARFDGGVLESRKAKQSLWGSRFTPLDSEVLANLYGKYGDRMIELLDQAKINFVWVTFSAGFSDHEEKEQRAQLRELTKKLHAHGIKVAAYMCATTVFWESMFRDFPQSAKWIVYDDKDVPRRYSRGRDPMRFFADINHPGWINHEKMRVGAIIDDGYDAIFLDNVAFSWHNPASLANFFEQLRDYARNEKKSDIYFFTNLGFHTPFAALNQHVDFIFGESWVEPGAWGATWDVSNIRRNKFIRGSDLGLKPLVSEYSIYHEGDRNDSFQGLRSQKLSIAESAAYGSSYTWDMEGPFDTALVTDNPKAKEAWKGIGQYNSFLADHTSFYIDAQNVAPWVVLLPDNLDPDFDWSQPAARLDFLAQKSVLCDFRFANRVTARDLDKYQGVLVPAPMALSSGQKEMVRDYQTRGGKAYLFNEKSDANGLNAGIFPVNGPGAQDTRDAHSLVAAEINSQAPDATRVELDSENHLLANVTTVDQGKTLIVHLLNYDQSPTKTVKAKLVLGKDLKKFANKKPVLLSPDANTTFQQVKWKNGVLEATLPSVDTYSLIILR